MIPPTASQLLPILQFSADTMSCMTTALHFKSLFGSSDKLIHATATCLLADPRLTDYDTLLKNIQDLRSGQPTQVCASAGTLSAAHAQLCTTCHHIFATV